MMTLQIQTKNCKYKSYLMCINFISITFYCKDVHRPTIRELLWHQQYIYFIFMFLKYKIFIYLFSVKKVRQPSVVFQ